MAEMHKASVPTTYGCLGVAAWMGALAFGAGAGAYLLIEGHTIGVLTLIGCSGTYAACMVVTEGIAQERKAYWEARKAEGQPIVNLNNANKPLRNLNEIEGSPYHDASGENISQFEANTIAHMIPARNIVKPHIPDFVTVTQMAELAYAVRAGAEVKHRDWAGRKFLDNGQTTRNPFSDTQYRKLRKWMLDRGFWEKERDTENSPVFVTEAGAYWLGQIVSAFPRPSVIYRHKA